MVKKQLIALLHIAIILMLSISSAYDGYYYPSDNTPKRTIYNYDKESYVNYYPWGTEKVSTTTRTTKTTEGYYPNTYYSYAPVYYSPSGQYSPTQVYKAPSSSNWRYKAPYNCYDYECSPSYKNYNSYQMPHYYAPRYDSNLGYYNWRY